MTPQQPYEPQNSGRGDEVARDPEWFAPHAPGLEATIAQFKASLPGWWFSVCECQVSCDASCAPTTDSRDVDRIPFNVQFDGGFHADLPQPSTLAAALHDVMTQALQALAEDDHIQHGRAEVKL